MRTNYFFGIILLSLIAISFSACNDDNAPLSFDQDSYEVPAQGNRYLGPASGNGDYTLTVSDPQVASAAVEQGWSSPGGSMIVVQGLQKGETTLTVTDKATNETRELHIRVTDGYETYRISQTEPETDLPALKGVPFVFLVANEERDLHFFNQIQTRVTKGDLSKVAQGKYAFSIEGDKFYLTLTYASDDQGRLTDAAIAPTPHKFLITNTGSDLMVRLNKSLNLGLPIASLRNSPAPNYRVMNLLEVGTGYKVEGSFIEEGMMPDGILK